MYKKRKIIFIIVFNTIIIIINYKGLGKNIPDECNALYDDYGVRRCILIILYNMITFY